MHTLFHVHGTTDPYTKQLMWRFDGNPPCSDAMPANLTRKTDCLSLSPGFTLIELVVVVFLISLMLFLAVPRFESTLFTDADRTSKLWITTTIQNLKEKAVREQTDYQLHVNLDENRMWISRTGMSEGELEDARQAGHRFAKGLTLMDVAFPDGRKIASGEVPIRFNRKGYSSMAMIHVIDPDNRTP